MSDPNALIYDTVIEMDFNAGGAKHDHDHDHGHGHAHGHEHEQGHGHHHEHEHGHGHGHAQKAPEDVDYVKANKDHFDANVDVFDNPVFIELARRVAAGFRKLYNFDENKSVVLDFACGTGLISRELAADVKSIVGVDISPGVVEKYNQTVSNQGIPPEEMRAVCVELKGVDGELNGLKFDVIVCANSYHHFPDVKEMTKILAFFLKPGGSLLVVDFLANEDGSSTHPDNFVSDKFKNIVAHKHGFSEEEIKGVFEGAGLQKFELKKLSKAKVNGTMVTLFVAKASKPEA